MTELNLGYVNLGMPCQSMVCNTNKSTWFTLTEIDTINKRQRTIMICDDCAIEFDMEIYKAMVQFSEEKNYEWPSDWIEPQERLNKEKEDTT